MIKDDISLIFSKEIRDEIFSTSCNVSSIVRKYITMLQYKNETDELIKGELYGFNNISTVPNYRKIIFKEGPIIPPNDFTYHIMEPIAIVEKLMNSGKNVVITDKVTYFPMKYNISAEKYHYVVEAVKNILLNLVNKVIIEKEYIEMHDDIYFINKNYLDEKLLELNPNLLKNLTDSYNELKDVDDAISASKIAFSCRQILQEFSDNLYKDEYLPEGHDKPSKSQIKNKIKYALTNVKSKTNRKLVESQIEYLSNLMNFIQKNIHPNGYDAQKEDANKCIIYTSLVMSDIIKLLER